MSDKIMPPLTPMVMLHEEPAPQPIPFADPRGVAEEADEDLDLLDLVRERLDIGDAVSDVTIASSLANIAAFGEPRDRWLAAFSSPLGKWLAARGTDLNSALNVLMALAPRAQG